MLFGLAMLIVLAALAVIGGARPAVSERALWQDSFPRVLAMVVLVLVLAGLLVAMFRSG